MCESLTVSAILFLNQSTVTADAATDTRQLVAHISQLQTINFVGAIFI